MVSSEDTSAAMEADAQQEKNVIGNERRITGVTGEGVQACSNERKRSFVYESTPITAFASLLIMQI